MIVHAGETVQIPTGVFLDGARHHDAVVRPLTGNDEAHVLEIGGRLSPAQLTTALLERCILRLGPLDPPSRDVIRELTVGDREALLLQVRRLTLGDRLQCTLDCNHPECQQSMDLELSVSTLLLQPYRDVQPWYDTAFDDGGRKRQVRYRVPSGKDQEAAAALSEQGAHRGPKVLLERCVQLDGEKSPVEPWTPALVEHVARQMAERDPQADLIIDVECVECGRPLQALFDAAMFLLREITLRVRHVYREVHLLAYHYHWSEAEIMAMTMVKRHRYLELLEEQLSGGRRA